MISSGRRGNRVDFVEEEVIFFLIENFEYCFFYFIFMIRVVSDEVFYVGVIVSGILLIVSGIF